MSWIGIWPEKMQRQMDISGWNNAENLLKSRNKRVRPPTLGFPVLNKDLAVCEDINPGVWDAFREWRQNIWKREDFLCIDIKVALRRRPIIMNSNRLSVGVKRHRPTQRMRHPHTGWTSDGTPCAKEGSRSRSPRMPSAGFPTWEDPRCGLV